MTILKPTILVGLCAFVASCSFNFELTSQKTALENQVMGSYKELDDDVIQMASVRGVNKDGTKTTSVKISDPAKLAIEAKQNQDFNRDDIDELKDKQIVGEAKSGDLVILPKGFGQADSAKPEDLKLAHIIMGEENRDRGVILRRIVTSNENLSAKDLDAARTTYRRKVIEDSPPGTWFQNEAGEWTRKPAKTKDSAP